MAALAGSLDANILLRLLLDDVPAQHTAVINLLDTEDEFAVADTAIMEVTFALVRHYGFTRAQIREAVQGLLDLPQLRCNRAAFELALPLYINHPKLSFEDCYLAAQAEVQGAAPLWTFDRKLAGQAPSAQLVGS